MYPNMMQPIPFIKHKSKHPIGATTQEKNIATPEKNVENEQKKEENNENNGVETQNQNQMQEETKLEERVATKKIRCKNWPACKDPNCIYAHPTETVSFI